MILGQTSLEEFQALRKQALAQRKNLVPICQRLMYDTITPLGAYQQLRRDNGASFLLESVVQGERIGRYSFVGANPQLSCRVQGNDFVIYHPRPSHHIIHPLKHLKQLMDEYQSLVVPGLPPFTGGAVGYIGYDAIRLIEPTVPDQTKDDLHLPDIWLHFFGEMVVFDNVDNQAYLIVNVPVSTTRSDFGGDYHRALSQIQRMYSRLTAPLPADLHALDVGDGKGEVSSNFRQDEFETAVRRCQEHIAAGDIFQVVISQRFSVPLTVSGLAIYRAMRLTNPSPYMFHLDMGEGVELIGASPEVLVEVQDRQMRVRPIAGTRRRSHDPKEDERLAQELRHDPKELAEHRMLVDLGRNDVGRVCLPGTVKVTEEMVIERYSHVMHLVSNVVGKLRPEYHPLDAFFAGFPAGTLTGAPKIRAMQIIDEVEPTRRGPYGGGVGWFGFNGNLDTCIVIRTILVKGSSAYFQAGAGIVADSDPTREFSECLAKAKAPCQSIELTGNGATMPTRKEVPV